jgi:hypothetical protein
LLNFELKFSNPSTVAVQQKLALISSKIEIAAKAWDLSKETGFLSINHIQREILQLRPEEINVIRQEALRDQVWLAELKQMNENPVFDNSIESNVDLFDKSNYEVPKSPFSPDPNELKQVEHENEEMEQNHQKKIEAARRAEAGEKRVPTSSPGAPIRFNPSPNLDKSFGRKDRGSKEFTGSRALAMPDYKSMLDITKNRYDKDPFDVKGMRKFILENAQGEGEEKGTRRLLTRGGVSREMQSSLRRMYESFFPTPARPLPVSATAMSETDPEISVDEEEEDELLRIAEDLKIEV